MNAKQMQQAALEAAKLIEGGECPDALAHVLYCPSDCTWSDEEIQGLSTPVHSSRSLRGHTERYYTLGEMAGW